MNTLLSIETNLASELIAILDGKLSEIIEKSTEVEDADQYGYFDSAEHLTGLGFVACQTYMTAVYGVLKVNKKRALSFGPMHESGRSIAQVIDAAANYWKHHNEWSLDKSSRRREIIESAFGEVGFPVALEYPLSGVLTEASSPKFASFRAVFDKLEEWKRNVEEGAT